MMHLTGIISLWRDWIGVAILLLFGFVFLPKNASIQSYREQYTTARCKDQMEMILRAEQKHYLDHNSYTTVQRDLSRYEAFAQHANCPLCDEPYKIEITDREIWVQCPCSPGIHGWKHATVPRIPKNTSTKEDLPPDEVR